MTRFTVYILDDEADLVELHSLVAVNTGFVTKGFTRGKDFFAQTKQFDQDSIMILDLQMPEMDGIEVMRRLARMHQPPALLLLSGHDPGVLHAAEKLCLAHGLDILATLSKPLALETLQEILEHHISADKQKGEISTNAEQEALTLDDLWHAMRNDQLVLYFQPQVDIKTGALRGVEALIRWQHPEMGLLTLEKLIALAEQNDEMKVLTHWVIDNVITQEQHWRNMGIEVMVSVNISAKDITSLVLPEQLAELLEENKLDATRLTLEITESALMGELVTSLDILTRLRLKGIGLSIDDFGTGYSSLSQLHRVPFTELKIDRSFVSKIRNDEEARAIVKTCILLGHELRMKVVAEGVETEKHYQILKHMGCDIAQGYFIAKPMPADALLVWMKNRDATKQLS